MHFIGDGTEPGLEHGEVSEQSGLVQLRTGQMDFDAPVMAVERLVGAIVHLEAMGGGELSKQQDFVGVQSRSSPNGRRVAAQLG